MTPDDQLVDPARVRLDLAATTREAAVLATAELLRGDARIGSWEEFWKSVGPKQVVDLNGCSCGICLVHGRSDKVKHLALSAARLAAQVPVAAQSPVQAVFVFAIPSAMSEEYLRRVGALARCCKYGAKLSELLAASSPEEFARLLNEWLG